MICRQGGKTFSQFVRGCLASFQLSLIAFLSPFRLPGKCINHGLYERCKTVDGCATFESLQQSTSLSNHNTCRCITLLALILAPAAPRPWQLMRMELFWPLHKSSTQRFIRKPVMPSKNQKPFGMLLQLALSPLQKLLVLHRPLFASAARCIVCR